MAKPWKVIQYIKECFYVYNLDYEKFFCYDYENGDHADTVWCDDKKHINMNAVAHASMVLGISVDDILHTNRHAQEKWLKKYCYFDNFKSFTSAYDRTHHAPEFYVNNLTEALFGVKQFTEYRDRYEPADIVNRLVQQLKEMDKTCPGTIHEGAKITKIGYHTDNFCKFDNMRETVISYLSMVDRIIELFIKTVNNELSDNEINEYNLLVSVFGLRDRYYNKSYIYHNTLINVKDAFAHVTRDNFFDIMRFVNEKAFQPWKCSDFINDRELVEKYLYYFPAVKGDMRQHAVNSTYIDCIFTWSDATPVILSPEEEEEYQEYCELSGEEYIPFEEREKERTNILIKKTAYELQGDEKTADRIIEYCRPEKLGGIRVNIPEYFTESGLDMTMKTMRRFEALHGNVPSHNYVQRIIDESNRSRGGSV